METAISPDKIIYQGAEARLYRDTFLGRPCIVKERFSKKYRHPQLDQKLTVSRITGEGRCITRCRKGGVDCPVIYFVDEINGRIYMECVEGPTVRDHIRIPEQAHTVSAVCRSIGHALASLHNIDVVHGDLTTANMMVRQPSTHTHTSSSSVDSEAPQVVLIDFGLAYTSAMLEDKAVDLYVLERATKSTHPEHPDLFTEILAAYREKSKKADAVISKFEDVRLRGRKRLMIG